MDSLVVVTGHINCHIKKSDYNGKFIKTEDRTEVARGWGKEKWRVLV